MPLYEYACQNCGQQSELLVHSSGQPICPECGSTRLDKLLSIVAAPARDSSTAVRAAPPAGSCGSSCGCFPRG